MTPDPLIDEIHEVRRKISAEFGHDPKRLVAHYIEMGRQLKAEGKYRFVSSPLSPVEPAALHDKPRKD